MRAAGHELLTPSYTGLGERAHLATPEIGLETHIQDIVNVAEFENLTDFVLLGHSYGGMVATGAADRLADRIRLLVYLDAFVPRDGESLAGLVAAHRPVPSTSLKPPTADDWQIPPRAPSSDYSPEDLEWVLPRRMPQPRKTFLDAVSLTGAVEQLPRAYIYCLRITPEDDFGPFAARARTEPGWRYEEIDASHSPHITVPETLAEILDRLAAG